LTHSIEPEIGTKYPCVGGPLDGQSREYKAGEGFCCRVQIQPPKIQQMGKPIDMAAWEWHAYELAETPEGLMFQHKESHA
jgi:hypothetical protein